MKEKLLNVESKTTKVVWILCGISLLAGTGLVFVITVARYAFNISWEWAEELSRYCVLFAALVGSGPMVFKGTHISMELIAERLKNKKLIFFHQMLSLVCILILATLIFIWSIHLVEVTHMKSMSLIFPMQKVYMMIPVAMGIMVLYSLLKISVLLTDMPWKKGEVK